jgi:hypothetical protein
MNDRQLSHLKTGVLFVAPGQIMDPGIMKLPHHADHLSRLRADVGLDALEAELASIEQRGWSFRQVLEQIRRFATAKLSSRTPTYTGTVQHR